MEGGGKCILGDKKKLDFHHIPTPNKICKIVARRDAAAAAVVGEVMHHQKNL